MCTTKLILALAVGCLLWLTPACSFSIGNTNSTTNSNNSNNTNSANKTTPTPAATSSASSNLISAALSTNKSGDAPASTFSSDQHIYVIYKVKNVPVKGKFYCNLYSNDVEGMAANTQVRALSYWNTGGGTVADNFDLDPKDEGWAKGTYRVELFLAPDADAKPEILKTLELTVE